MLISLNELEHLKSVLKTYFSKDVRNSERKNTEIIVLKSAPYRKTRTGTTNCFQNRRWGDKLYLKKGTLEKKDHIKP